MKKHVGEQINSNLHAYSLTHSQDIEKYSDLQI